MFKKIISSFVIASLLLADVAQAMEANEEEAEQGKVTLSFRTPQNNQGGHALEADLEDVPIPIFKVDTAADLNSSSFFNETRKSQVTLTPFLLIEEEGTKHDSSIPQEMLSLEQPPTNIEVQPSTLQRTPSLSEGVPSMQQREEQRVDEDEEAHEKTPLLDKKDHTQRSPSQSSSSHSGDEEDPERGQLSTFDLSSLGKLPPEVQKFLLFLENWKYGKLNKKQIAGIFMGGVTGAFVGFSLALIYLESINEIVTARRMSNPHSRWWNASFRFSIYKSLAGILGPLFAVDAASRATAFLIEQGGADTQHFSLQKSQKQIWVSRLARTGAYGGALIATALPLYYLLGALYGFPEFVSFFEFMYNCSMLSSGYGGIGSSIPLWGLWCIWLFFNV